MDKKKLNLQFFRATRRKNDHYTKLYGYELAKMAREVSGSVFDIKEGTLYMALKRLEKQGLLTSFWGDPDEGSAGRRKYYSLTDEGLIHLRNGKRDWEAFKIVIDQFLGGVQI
jgi:PadR family transcriptional regulator, regulatory protein PadR